MSLEQSNNLSNQSLWIFRLSRVLTRIVSVKSQNQIKIQLFFLSRTFKMHSHQLQLTSHSSWCDVTLILLLYLWQACKTTRPSTSCVSLSKMLWFLVKDVVVPCQRCCGSLSKMLWFLV